MHLANMTAFFLSQEVLAIGVNCDPLQPSNFNSGAVCEISQFDMFPAWWW